MGGNAAPLRCSILTYFMGIARLKFLEYVRDEPSHTVSYAEEEGGGRGRTFDVRQYVSTLYDSADDSMLDIISDLVSRMSGRCGEIIRKFYYEGKNLDAILLEIPTIESKNALKTKKYKCMEALRGSAKEIYHRYLNT